VYMGVGCFVFFFQAEDGIRDWSVTGVQTCALPISVTDQSETGGWPMSSDVTRASRPWVLLRWASHPYRDHDHRRDAHVTTDHGRDAHVTTTNLSRRVK